MKEKKGRKMFCSLLKKFLKELGATSTQNCFISEYYGIDVFKKLVRH